MVCCFKLTKHLTVVTPPGSRLKASLSTLFVGHTASKPARYWNCHGVASIFALVYDDPTFPLSPCVDGGTHSSATQLGGTLCESSLHRDRAAYLTVLPGLTGVTAGATAIQPAGCCWYNCSNIKTYLSVAGVVKARLHPAELQLNRHAVTTLS